MEEILYTLVGVVVCAILGGVVYVLAKNDKKKDEERISNMTEEQKREILTTPYLGVSGLPNAVLAHGLIYEIPKMTNRKAELVVMFNNEYFPNGNGISHADINVSIKEFNEHNLKVGDYVKILLNEDKFPKLYFD
jgi:hypothetical protein